jgi:hypothetical protein
MSERDDRPVLPTTTDDESDVGWGERHDDEDADDVKRFIDEKPPHHDA